MMMKLKLSLLTLVMLSGQSFIASNAEAGPLLDWLRGKKNNCCRSAQPAYGYYPTAATTAQFAGTAQSPYNLQPGQCMKTCQQTCSRTVVNYVPTTEYRTNWNRVPVTQYRPVTNSDPCTGCTVTCMKPCTTYTYKMQRVPYTTYKPVYRTETYKVPVTTITNDCASGNCSTGCCSAAPAATSGCATCGSAPAANFAPTGNFAPTPAVNNFAPTGNFAPTLAPTNGSSSRSLPANTAPTLAPETGSLNSMYSSSVPSNTLSTESTFNTRGFNTARADVYPNRNERRVTEVAAMSRTTPGQSLESEYNNLTRGRSQDRGFTPRESESNRPQANDRFDNQTASASPIRREWSYSPVRLASYHAEVESDAPVQMEVQSIRRTDRSPSRAGQRSLREINSLWNDVR